MLIRLLLVLLLCALPALDRFESSIQNYEAEDAKHPPAQYGTLFVGSSTVAIWGRDLEREFQALNRGFGGSTIPEINHYAARIVVPYHPRRIVFYAGTNDIAEGHSAEQVARDFQQFVDVVSRDLPEVRIAFISMSMPPSRVQFEAQYGQANRLIQAYCKSRKNLFYLDVSRLLLDHQGQPRPQYFREDRLHMTPAGYAVWAPKIHQLLKEME